jgi:Xaa-Pro aminopeptidase
VLDAVGAALAAVRPGQPAPVVDGAAREALARHSLERAFGHSTGHGLGLEVHEEPRVGRPVDGLPPPVLQAGMALTIEPGVYLSGLCGVRVEDDVVVTPDGYELLTDAPRSLVVVSAK